MEKKTILAVVLSTAVLIGFYLIQGALNPPAPPQPIKELQQVQPVMPSAEETLQSPAPVRTEQVKDEAETLPAVQIAEPVSIEYVTIDTDLITVKLSSAGGNVVSYKLKNHWEDPQTKTNNVEMIVSGDKEAQAFAVAFGGFGSTPVTSNFFVNRISDTSVEFSRDFLDSAGEKFTLYKRYDFSASEYMFKLTITLDGGYYGRGFNFNGNAYTLSFGPQIGPKPKSERNDRYADFRQYSTLVNGKHKKIKPNDINSTSPAWSAISGKYFAFIAIPSVLPYSFNFTEIPEPGLSSASRFNLMRPAVDTPKLVDTYHFYLGPKNQKDLNIYYTGLNEFGFINSNIVEVSNSRGILAPLERFLKWLLLLFHKVIPNYGIAIILLTLLVKIVFFPLTKKSSEATLRMQALQPKIKELQEKYKDNPKKLNQEMGLFYQKEGYNPLSGCLPMLLQIPIFFAMYSLFNNHFDLRGAEFIPGWIPDLSVPEYIWQFPGDFRLPIVGWTALRALPFIYVASQLLYGKFTQTPGQQSGMQMKMMLYVMPIMFFFILYNVPSGLLIYWIFSNILTLVQQVIISKYNAAKKNRQGAEPEPSAGPKIAPKKKGKKF